MTITINSRPVPGLSGATAALRPREFKTSTYDEGWAATLAILTNRDFRADVERGLAEIDGGERLYSFEEVFGDDDPV